MEICLGVMLPCDTYLDLRGVPLTPVLRLNQSGHAIFKLSTYVRKRPFCLLVTVNHIVIKVFTPRQMIVFGKLT